jgi:M6 family metalloprotease-like protein
MLSVWAQTNSSWIDDAFDREGSNSVNGYELVGLQSEERWLVLRVSFPDEPFPENIPLSLFEGETSAHSYIEQMSGNRSSLRITLIDQVWQSPHPESEWGMDSSVERDVGGDYGGASDLAAAAIDSLLSGIDLSDWDLDGDGVIDRLLILHSGEAQELGGPSSSIWSHYSPLQDSITKGDFSFEHYTMVSINGGLGVLIHEMLHQMGAVDLYDVHSDTPTRNWHGLGDWGIMASGNWIEDGNLPSLPSSSTLDLIGGLTGSGILSQNESKSYTLKPIPKGGGPMAIKIAPGEFVWVTYRANYGFDGGLPGHGILVEQQDTNYGDIGDNLANTDPAKAWVRIIEADGDDALLRARDYGSQGDVFTEGESFGSSGHQIRDNRGRLVNWTILVNNVSEDQVQIQYTKDENSIASVVTPRSPIVLMPGEVATATVSTLQTCILLTNLSTAESINLIQVDKGRQYLEVSILDTNAIGVFPGDSGRISGTMGCEGHPPYDLSLEWYSIPHRLSNETIEAIIPWDEPSTINLNLNSEGTGPRTYSVSIDGAADRVASVPNQVRFEPGDSIILQIDPSGLLEPGMIARGELVFIDSNKLEQRISIVLHAEQDFLLWGPLRWLAAPSNAISLICLLLVASVATGKRDE